MTRVVRLGLAVAALWLTWTALGGTARAISASANADMIYVGNVGTVPYVCWHSVGSGTEHWTALGDGTGMTANYPIYGGGGDDGMTVFRFNYTISAGNPCDASWSALDYSGHWLDLYGEAGVDVISGGNEDTYSSGGDDHDAIYANTAIQQNHGDGGGDSVYGNAGDAEDLYGDLGDDCLEDLNNAVDVEDCGNGFSDYYYYANTPTSGCENFSVSHCAAL